MRSLFSPRNAILNITETIVIITVFRLYGKNVTTICTAKNPILGSFSLFCFVALLTMRFEHYLNTYRNFYLRCEKVIPNAVKPVFSSLSLCSTIDRLTDYRIISIKWCCDSFTEGISIKTFHYFKLCSHAVLGPK